MHRAGVLSRDSVMAFKFFEVMPNIPDPGFLPLLSMVILLLLYLLHSTSLFQKADVLCEIPQSGAIIIGSRRWYPQVFVFPSSSEKSQFIKHCLRFNFAVSVKSTEVIFASPTSPRASRLPRSRASRLSKSFMSLISSLYTAKTTPDHHPQVFPQPFFTRADLVFAAAFIKARSSLPNSSGLLQVDKQALCRDFVRLLEFHELDHHNQYHAMLNQTSMSDGRSSLGKLGGFSALLT
jgi:hypothetical protein